MDRVEGPTKLPEGLKGIGMGLGSSGTPLTDVSSKFFNDFFFESSFRCSNLFYNTSFPGNFSGVNNPPVTTVAPNIHQLQAAAAAAQAQVQLAQVGKCVRFIPCP